MRNLGLYIMSHRRNAAWVALLFALLPFIQLPTGWISSVIVGLVTLRKGPKEGLWVIAWVALPAIALLCLGYPGLMISMVAVRCLLVFLLAWLLRRYNSWLMVLEVIAIIGLIGVALTHLIIPQTSLWWASHLSQFTAQMSSSLNLTTSPQLLKDYVSALSKIASGSLAVFVLSLDLLTLFLARWWQCVLFNQGGLRKEFYNIRMGYAINAALILCLLGVVLGSDFALDALPVLMLPFVIAGLSLTHVFAAHKNYGAGMLACVYIPLILFLPYVSILLAAMGAIDSWYDFRSRVLYSSTNANK